MSARGAGSNAAVGAEAVERWGWVVLKAAP